MTIRLLHALTFILVLAAPIPDGRAAPDRGSGALTASSRELIVFETARCLYCDLFRRNVAPGYLTSAHAKEVPMRFVDISRAGTSMPALADPLTILPTVVLLSEGREVGRIAGYTGPENFSLLVSRMLTGT